MKKVMAKSVHPLMSVTGNFGKYGGAYTTHATLIGAANKGPGHQVFFRGVIRAPEAARAAINATSNDLKAEVRRRMGRQYIIDQLNHPDWASILNALVDRLKATRDAD